MGEKIDADEEERKEEIFKERRHVTKQFRQAFVEAKPEYESSGINLVPSIRKPEGIQTCQHDCYVSLGKGLDETALFAMASSLSEGSKGGQ